MTDIPDRARLAFRIQVEESWPTTRAERSTLRAARVQQASGQSVPFRLHGTRELKHRLPRLRRFASNFSVVKTAWRREVNSNLRCGFDS